jgi:hypothetical protein
MKNVFKNPAPKWMFGVAVAMVMAICLPLSFLQYKARAALSQGQSFCAGVENCDASVVSHHTNPFGVPFAIWVVFLEIGVVALFLLKFKKQASTKSITWLSAFLSATIVLIQILLAVAGVWSLYLFLAAIFCLIQTYASSRGLAETENRLGKPWIEAAAVVILASLMSWASNEVILKNTSIQQAEITAERSLDTWDRTLPQNINTEEGIFISQSEGGEPTFTIVEYSDLLAMNWKSTASELKSFIQSHSGVRLIWKPFPLDIKCNNRGPTVKESARCDLAEGVYCAEKMGHKGHLAYDWIYRHHEDLQKLNEITPVLEDFANVLQLPVKELQNCLRSESTIQWIQNSVKEGYAARVRIPPTLFVNGKLLPNANISIALEDIYQKSK